MRLYMAGAVSGRSNHRLFVSPAGDPDLHGDDIPAEWRNEDGTPKLFVLEFVNGRLDNVPANLAKYCIRRGLARMTQLILPGDSAAA